MFTERGGVHGLLALSLSQNANRQNVMRESLLHRLARLNLQSSSMHGQKAKNPVPAVSCLGHNRRLSLDTPLRKKQAEEMRGGVREESREKIPQ